VTGKQIQRLRRSLGESAAEFGKRFGVSGRTIESWENDRYRPNRWVLPLIVELQKTRQRRTTS
jgi:DNA-binding transcriptional regulator YiaG